jgi:hypothetical protein
MRAVIRAQVDAGVDFVKLYAGLSPDQVQVAIAEAHRLGIPVTGRLQRTTWTEAAALGIDAITHTAPPGHARTCRMTSCDERQRLHDHPLAAAHRELLPPRRRPFLARGIGHVDDVVSRGEE